MSTMRHNENIKRLLAAGLLTLGASTASAQIVIPNSWNVGDTTWNSNGNWLLESNNSFIPSNNEGLSFAPEYAVIDNGGTANVIDVVAEHPTAVSVGDAASMTGHMVVSGGHLYADAIEYTVEEFAMRGLVVIGNAGNGTLIQSGGLLESSHGFVMNRLAGSTSTFTMSGGTFNAAKAGGTTSIGAGGGEAAIWNMEGGTFNQLNGEINIGDNNGQNSGILTMTGGIITTSAGDLDIAGLNGGQGIVSMSNNASMTIAAGTWVGIGTDSATMARFSATDTASLTTVNFLMLQTADSLSTFSGNSSLTVTDTLDLDIGKFRVEGSGVTINTNNVSLQGNYNLQIGAGGHSVINATGATSLGGTLELDFDGVTPAIGDTYRIVAGANKASGWFDNVTGKPLAEGAKYATLKDGGNVDIAVEAALTLSYNTASGSTTIKDVIGGVKLKGYTLNSDGALNSAAWHSLESASIGNLEVVFTGANQLSEIGSPELAAAEFATGQIHNLGSILSAIEDDTAFGTKASAGNLTLDYIGDDNLLRQAIVKIEGTENNLVLHVNTTTGEISLQNHSTKDVELRGYSIKSAEGDLDASGWVSMSEDGVAGWDEANPTANQLSELIDVGETMELKAGTMISLGMGATAGLDESLVLEFLLGSDDAMMSGVVIYDDMVASLEGDWDLDGDVDAEDLAIVQAHFGDNATLSDLFAVRNNFGAVAAVTAVPEPTSLLLLAGALAAAGKRRRKQA